jgi:hypothetical protein
VDAVREAGKALFGADFTMVPAFGLPAAQAGELGKALSRAAEPGFIDHLRNNVGVDFPIDEWLCGVARVREAMHT